MQSRWMCTCADFHSKLCLQVPFKTVGGVKWLFHSVHESVKWLFHRVHESVKWLFHSVHESVKWLFHSVHEECKVNVP